MLIKEKFPRFYNGYYRYSGYIILFLSIFIVVVIIVNIHRNRNLSSDIGIVNTEDWSTIFGIDEGLMKDIHTVYVIPGGGSNNASGYPEWTKRRVVSAYDHYKVHFENKPTKKNALFIALSAGSLNSANRYMKDGRVVFECQHIVHHLTQLGVSKDVIFGDMFSWDTVTNGWTLRMLLEGIQVYRRKKMLEAKQIRKNSMLRALKVEVFISDFHADRVRATFDWVLNLSPKLEAYEMHINIVSSMGIQWSTPNDYLLRIQHEKEGLQRIVKNVKSIKTVPQFFAFLTLGGHQGMRKYLQSDYAISQGGGW